MRHAGRVPIDAARGFGVLPVNYLLVFGVAVFSSASGALLIMFFELMRRRKPETPRRRGSICEEATYPAENKGDC